jgi:hypothetical protein
MTSRAQSWSRPRCGVASRAALRPPPRGLTTSGRRDAARLRAGGKISGAVSLAVSLIAVRRCPCGSMREPEAEVGTPAASLEHGRCDLESGWVSSTRVHWSTFGRRTRRAVPSPFRDRAGAGRRDGWSSVPLPRSRRPLSASRRSWSRPTSQADESAQSGLVRRWPRRSMTSSIPATRRVTRYIITRNSYGPAPTSRHFRHRPMK